MMNAISERLLRAVSDYDGEFKGAYNVRENGQCAGRHCTENIIIESKTDVPGLDIRIKAGTKGETISIPALVTQGNIDDLVYNDFYVGEGADVLIMAGCGVHTENADPARHNGIHRFFLEKNSKVKYVEKHIGTGDGEGVRSIDPVTEIELGENAWLEMDTAQIGGVDRSIRVTKATLDAGATLLIKESLLTEKSQYAKTEFDVEMNGVGAGTDLISRSVARGSSHQEYRSRMIGNNACSGHSECDAIIADQGTVDATPELSANHCDAALIHEAAIGKIAGEQILKLQTLGLTEEEAEAKIVEGFLSW